jgi:SIR2-like domain/CHAT domain
MRERRVEAEIILRWLHDAEAFEITLLYDDPSARSDYREFVREPLPIDTTKLVAGANEYGRTLGDILSQSPELDKFLDRALTAAATLPVHLRLLLDQNAPAKYQAIRWEALCRPDNGFPITTKDALSFSRYLESTSSNWRPLMPLPREDELKALVAVANPSDIANFATSVNVTTSGSPSLALVDVQKELDIARLALEGISIETLPNSKGDRATLQNIINALRNGKHILYLVCHGSIEDYSSKLYLEDRKGEVDEVKGAYFAQRIADLERPPTIAVLCSCQSAGPGDEYLPSDKGPLSPLGPSLGTAGVAAVVAMQGNVTMSTSAAFMPAFFKELKRSGLPDRAMSVARGGISKRPDWWMPVLFSRIRRGQPWYEPRFGGRERDIFENLRARITRNVCTPVLGSGIVGELILPHRSALAKEWAQRRQMPIVPPSRTDLAKVAQYLSIGSGRDMPRTELLNYLETHLRERFSAQYPELPWGKPPLQGPQLQELASKIAATRRKERPQDDPYAILASLWLPIYITTSWANLLENALTEARREPVVRYFPWTQDRYTKDKSVDHFDADHPLVYHMFGTISVPESLVLTEDDYFSWLRAWTKLADKSVIGSAHDAVAAALTQSLLFLGYGLDDWEFRIVFQGIKSFDGARSTMREKQTQHVGVQLRPETVTVESEAAQDYLETFFGEDNVQIYWGTCTDFLRDLRDSALKNDR